MTNHFREAFARHRSCPPAAMDYDDRGATCRTGSGGCGQRWIFTSQSSETGRTRTGYALVGASAHLGAWAE